MKSGLPGPDATALAALPFDLAHEAEPVEGTRFSSGQAADPESVVCATLGRQGRICSRRPSESGHFLREVCVVLILAARLTIELKGDRLSHTLRRSSAGCLAALLGIT
jgi:hypothetical protein